MYGFFVTVEGDFEQVVERVTEALKAEGFGVLTDIDVQKTLKAKLDIDRGPYRILGACNPPLAHRALEADSDIGLLLPCNVVVYESGSGTVVAALEPSLMAEMSPSPELAGVAAEARERLMRVIASLEG